MASASARKYQCTSPSSALSPAGTWSHVEETTWQIRPAWWPFVSAFVVRRPYAPPTLLTVAAETALLLENTNWRSGVNFSWSGAAMSCPSHMSRFLTESVGLCIAIQSASAYGWHPLRAILDADRLPTNSPLYVATGSRPDFVVQTTAGWHGIEARGRGSSGPVGTKRPVAAQKKKLKGLHDWAAQVAKHAQIAVVPSWSMSWAWITDTSTSVDHFDPGSPVALNARDEQMVWRQMGDVASKLADVDDPRVERVEALDRHVAAVSRPIQDDPGIAGPRWLTLASFSERLSAAELRERRAELVGQQAASSGFPPAPDRSALGAFMATAITDRPPSADGLRSLVESIALGTAESRAVEDWPG